MRPTSGATSNDLYQAVLDEIDDLLKQLDRDATDIRVVEVLAQVENLISPIHTDLVARIEALECHARWDTFTIAFYGETNAGKSTIIETLRMLLDERTKADARRAFRAKQAEFGLTESALSVLSQSIEASAAQLEALRGHIAGRGAQLDAERSAHEQELSRLRVLIDAKKQAASFWQKLMILFRKLPEETTLADGERQRVALDAAHASERERLAVQLEQALGGHAALAAKQTHAHAQLDSLTPLADGFIVGTGRSDYTLETHGYTFEVGGQHFELLDVPGIEGKEARVIDSILGAVKAAHAVFYVTGKAAAPQTGDENGQGTLEKIRAHLGDQTEVWTIFNKRITNPIQLEKDELLSQGERDSLAVLDATMHEHLGERYQRCIALSAQPAFLAAADCLVPLTDLSRNRAKFLAKADARTLIAKSGFRQFVDWLTGSMATDCEVRIRNANVNKVRSAIRVAAGTITLIQRDTVAPLAEQLKKDWMLVSEQLRLAVDGLGPSLTTVADGEIQTFESRVRKRMYDQIDGGIDNDDLQYALKRSIQDEQAKLEARLPDLMQARLERFQQDVAEVFEGFQRRVEQLQDVYRSSGTAELGGGFELRMEFDNGVNYLSLIAALGGGLLMWWNPVGWVSLAIGSVTLVVSLVKAVRGWFDSDYKKSQQRKVTNDNLDRVVEKMRGAMERNCAKVVENVTVRIDEVTAEVARSVEQAANVNSALIRVCANLVSLSNKISETEAV